MSVQYGFEYLLNGETQVTLYTEKNQELIRDAISEAGFESVKVFHEIRAGKRAGQVDTHTIYPLMGRRWLVRSSNGTEYAFAKVSADAGAVRSSTAAELTAIEEADAQLLLEQIQKAFAAFPPSRIKNTAVGALRLRVLNALDSARVELMGL